MITKKKIADKNDDLLGSRKAQKLNLFWGTFFLSAIALFVISLFWLQMFRTKENALRTVVNADQITRTVNTAKQALTEPGEQLRFSRPKIDSDRPLPLDTDDWLDWLAITLSISLGGAALMAGIINQPLKRLSFAASQLREGQFTTTSLDEKAATREIREVNIDFNRLAERLAKIEQERALMLAGISHDLRTPLARLRLETELSVSNLETRDLMSADIAQLDDIIDKFLDYARPEPTELGPVLLSSAISRSIAPWRNSPRFDIQVDVAEDLQVLAEPVELVRVLSNLLENARRYGQSPKDGVTRVEIVARLHEGWILLRVRDHGLGVSESTLKNLTQPFFRGDAARTAATGSGLGLAIVERSVQRMGGTFSVFNASGGGGGLMALMKFKQVAQDED